MVYAASNSQPPKTRTGAKYETQVDHQKELTNAHFFFTCGALRSARRTRAVLDQGHTRNFVCRVPRNWGSTTD